ITSEENIHFIYNCRPLQILTFDLIKQEERLQRNFSSLFQATLPDHYQVNFRNSAGPLKWNHGYLILVHECVIEKEARMQRYYFHRFLWFDAKFHLVKMSNPFYFAKIQVETVNGCLEYQSGLLLGVTLADRNTFLVYLDKTIVNNLLMKINFAAIKN